MTDELNINYWLFAVIGLDTKSPMIKALLQLSIYSMLTFSCSHTNRSCFHWATAVPFVGKSNAKGTGEIPGYVLQWYLRKWLYCKLIICVNSSYADKVNS